MGESGFSVGPGWYRAWVDGWHRAQIRRGRAKATIVTWGVYLRDLGRFLLDAEVDGAEDLTIDVLNHWQDGLTERLLPASQSVAAYAARALLKWTDVQDLSIRPGLWMKIETPAIPEREPRALEPDELRAILEHYTPYKRDLLWLRDRALFVFLLTSGSRINEALQVDRDQVDDAMVVRQKGGRQHRLVISARSRQWLGDYLRERGDDSEPALWIHVAQRGRFRLRSDGANEVWTQLAKQLGIRRFTSHALRHSVATELGHMGIQDEAIRKHVGWKSTAMLARYQELRDERRQAIVDRLDELIPPAPTPEPRPTSRRRRRRRFRVVKKR